MNWCQFTVITFIAVYAANLECPSQCKCRVTDLECYKKLPSFIPERVSKVSVHGIPADEILDFSSTDWMNVTHLSLSLNMTLRIEQRKMTLRPLGACDFTGLVNIKYLKILCTGKCYLHPSNSTFLGLKNIRVLDLSNNKFMYTFDLISGLEALPHLLELYLSNVASLEGPLKFFLDDLDKAMANKPLKILDISGTSSILYDPDYQILPHLEIFNISRSGKAVFTLNNLKVFKNLQVLDASYPDSPSSPTDCKTQLAYWHFCHEKYQSDNFLPLSLTELYIRNIFKSTIQLRGISNTTLLCIMNIFFEENVNICVHGNFSHLQKLVMSENSITYIQPELINPFERLEYLDISSNMLGEAISGENYAKLLFNALLHVHVLIMRNNSIRVIPKDVFNDNSKLRILDLSHNQLTNMDFGLQSMSFLEYLDISFNNIFNLHADSCSILKQLNVRPYLSINSSIIQQEAQMKVSLQSNPFSCSCESVCFFEYLIELNETFTCSLNDDTIVINDTSVRKVKLTCYKSIVIAVYSTLTMITVILTSVTIYFVIREKRKEYIIEIKERLIHEGKELYEMSPNKHVVFLSHSSDDKEFVLNNVYPKLELGLKQVLRTESRCVGTGDLDMFPGQPIAEEITRCIQNSLVVVFFVSDSFSESPWCRLEVTTATYSNKPILLMMSDNVDLEQMPSILRNHYQIYTRVHWSVEEGEPVITPSWDTICENIVRLIGTSQIP